MAAGGLLLLGSISVFRVPVALMPNTAFPGLTLQTEYSGIDPRKMEEIITRPLEDVVSTVGGIVRLFSVSEAGKSRINIEFAREADVDLKSLEVRERTDLVASGFPREVQKPVILRYDPDQKPIMIVAMESKTRELTELREVAEREVKKILEGVTGVSEIFVAGGRKREVVVSADKDRLESHGFSLNDLLGALQSRNVNSAAGKVKQAGSEFSVYTKGRFREINDIRALIVSTGKSGGRVHIRDVANVSYGYREQDSASRIGGLERVSLYIHKTSTANLLSLSTEVKERLDEYTRGDIKFRLIYDQADLVRAAFRNVFLGTAAGLLVAGLALYLLLGSVRDSLLLTAVVPFTFLFSSFFLFLADQEYNLMTLSGLILSAGVSLVFAVLTILAIRRTGRIPGTAAIQGKLIATALLIAAVFAPLVFADQDMRLIYGGLSAALLSATAAAVAYCLTVLPVLIGPSQRSGMHPRLEFLAGHLRETIKTRVPRAMTVLNEYCRARPRATALIFLGVPLVGFICLQFLRQEFINPLESGKINAQIEFPSGTSFKKTNKTARAVEKLISALGEVREVTSRVDPGQASLIVKLKEGAGASDELLATLKKVTGNQKPAFVHFSRESDAQTLREVTINVQGEKLLELDRITRALAKKAGGLSGVSGVLLRYKSPRPELRILIDKLKAEKAGISASTAGQYTRLAIQGGVATKFIERNREIDVRIRFREKYRRTLRDLNKFTPRGADGRQIPLPEISRLVPGTSPVKIYRKNKKRTLSFTLRLKTSDFDAIKENLRVLKKERLPENYRIEFGRELEKVIENRKKFIRILAASSVLIYMLLAAYFESLTRPFILLPALPIPITAVILVLFVFRMTLSVPILIGFILLSALVAMQCIFLVDGRNEDGDEQTEFIRSFTAAALIMIALYLPLMFILGRGGGLLRGIALCLITGTLVSILTTPLAVETATRLFRGENQARVKGWLRSWWSEKGTRYLGELRRRAGQSV